MLSEEIYKPAGTIGQRLRLPALDEDWAASIRAARYSERDFQPVRRETNAEDGASVLGRFALACVPSFRCEG